MIKIYKWIRPAGPGARDFHASLRAFVSGNRRNDKSLEYGKCLETGEATKFLKYGRGLSMESVKKRKIPCVMEKRHRHRAPNDLLDV